LLISQRLTGGPVAHLAYGAWAEAEDVLASTANWPVGLLDRHGMDPRIRVRRVAGRFARRFGPRATLVPPTRSVPVVESTEHVVFLAYTPWDMPLLEQLKGLRTSGATISVWLPEVWPTGLDDPRLAYECFSLIDHIFVGLDEAVDPFHRIAPNSEIHVLPPAVDVEMFRPATPFGHRGVTVLGIGRRDAAQHDELLDWSTRRDELYVYDTTKGRAPDWKEHRRALAGWYQHTSIAVCNYAKMGSESETGGLRVLPGRLFEALAAGAVMVGVPPDPAVQQRVLGCEVVQPIEPGSLSSTLDRILADERVPDLRRSNIALACRAHDWGHRWRTMFSALGMAVPVGLRNRLSDLDKVAAKLEEIAGP
jgi:glycosyltransferase involved in cell wall biosynthesis